MQTDRDMTHGEYMNIYLISQDINFLNSECFESAVVLAENEEEARMIHPSQGYNNYSSLYWNLCKIYSLKNLGMQGFDWAYYPSQVSIIYLGKYDGEYYKEKAVVCKSFIKG